ncbi:hypothetical protein IV505_16725 [Pseudomonas fulva]|nr:hypothetical protein [Pseudomonas fulva]MBF8781357.1 hypothetical protein [Pseudomonas fulva]
MFNLPGPAAELALACFFLLMIPARRRLHRIGRTVSPVGLFISSLVLGSLTGNVQSTGRLNLILFTLIGLTRGALLGTEAAASLAVYLTKTTTFSWLGVVDARLLLNGMLVG